MKERLGLDAERNIRAENRRQQLTARLNRPLRPPMLLRLERVHLDRYFRRRNQLRDEHESPPPELRPVAQVEILGQRVVLPSTGIRDRGAAPDTRRAVEVEEAAAAIAGAVFEHEMAVEQDRLDLRQE